MKINKDEILKEQDKETLVLKFYDYEIEDIIESFTLADLKRIYCKVYNLNPRSNVSKNDLINSIRGYARSCKRRDAFNR